MHSRGRAIIVMFVMLAAVSGVAARAQSPSQPERRFRIEGGRLVETKHERRSDSLRRDGDRMTSIRDSLITAAELLQFGRMVTRDAQVTGGTQETDSTAVKVPDQLTAPDSLTVNALGHDLAGASQSATSSIGLGADATSQGAGAGANATSQGAGVAGQNTGAGVGTNTGTANQNIVSDSVRNNTAAETPAQRNARLVESLLEARKWLPAALDSAFHSQLATLPPHDTVMRTVISHDLRAEATNYEIWARNKYVEAEEEALKEGVPAQLTLADTAIVHRPSKREIKREERRLRLADTAFVRYSPIFRDTMPLSRMTAISLVVPGFSQLHNKQAWKIPVFYATTGAAVYFGIKEHDKYKPYKKEYDYLSSIRAGRDRLDPVQDKMIKYNTTRQLLFGAAAATYIYMLADGVMNHPGSSMGVKKATTLSTILPGAGQLYNRSYWKAPIVLGGFATLLYTVDWNNRGYQRFKLAYELETDDDPATQSEFQGSVPPESLQNLRNSYRRSRDLCIIFTGALYLLNLVDAHVDAHMKDYDISDNLNITLEPTIGGYSTRSGGYSNVMGFTLGLNF